MFIWSVWQLFCRPAEMDRCWGNLYLLRLSTQLTRPPPFVQSITELLQRYQIKPSQVSGRSQKVWIGVAAGTFGFLFLDGLVPSLLRRDAGVMRAALRSEHWLRQPETEPAQIYWQNQQPSNTNNDFLMIPDQFCSGKTGESETILNFYRN